MNNEFKRMQKLAGLITESQLNKEEGTPSDGMHQVILSYIKPEFRDTYPKDYNKFFTFLKIKMAVFN